MGVAALALMAAVAAAAAPSGGADDLTGLSLEQLLDLRVVGASKYHQKQIDVPAAVSVVTRQEIRAFGWRALDEVLASLPGVHTSHDRQYSYVGMRGFGLPGDYNTRMLVTINGNRLNDAVYDQAYMGRELPLDLAFVERIEFIPGPGGAVHGQNAMFGVVNIVTRRGADMNGGEIAMSYQRPQSMREARLGWGSMLEDGTDVAFTVSGQRSRGEDRFFSFGDSRISGVAVGQDGERDAQIQARAARGPWSFDLIWGDRRKDDPTANNQSVPLTPGQFQADRLDLVQWQYQGHIGNASQASLRLFAGRSRFRGAFNFGSWFDGVTASNWEGAEVRLLHVVGNGHKLMLGAEAQRTSRADQEVVERADPAQRVSIRSPGHRVGVYLQDEWRVSAPLAITMGLRVDHSDRSEPLASPRVAVIWQPTEAATVKALYGRAYRAPNAYERDYGDGVSMVANPSLRQESIDTFELVAEQRLQRNFAIQGSIYHWNMCHIVTQSVDPLSGLAQYQSGKPLRGNGMALSADKTWGNGARLRASIALQNARRSNGQELPNSPDRLAKLNLSAPLPWAEMRLAFEARAESGRLALDGSRVGGYGLSNLRLSGLLPSASAEWSLQVGNLLNKRYAHPASASNWQSTLEQDGRSVRVELVHRF